VLKEEYYLAEGTTRQNSNDGYYDEWLTVYSPTDGNSVRVFYIFPDGSEQSKWYKLSTSRRLTVNVKEDVKELGHEGQDVSVRVEGDNPFTVGRPMYFNRHGVTGGSTVNGYVPPAGT
jgi:spore coat polysaccharide biosynthesis protein SpsF (cytidylyltransferase family)